MNTWESSALLGSRIKLIVIAMLLLSAGCANFSTISRHTDIPKGARSRAVHLDAQQRLVIFAADKYCAEPSPDALAAYAAAIGISNAKLPDSGTAASFSGGNAAASIGLRTQSITLMRDALYRMCEAAAGSNIGELQVAAFLNKSQDLTAVILAIEQLTGAVAVNPVGVGGSSYSSSSATLLANAQALETAKRIETEAMKSESEANEDLTAKRQAFEKEEVELGKIAAELKAETDPVKQKNLQVSHDGQEIKVRQAEEAVIAAKQVLQQREATHKNAKETLDAITRSRDSAILQSSAGVSTQIDVGGISRRDQLSDSAASNLAGSVERMVVHMLDKSYENEMCFNFLADQEAKESAARALKIIEAEASQTEKARNFSDSPITFSELEPNSTDSAKSRMAKAQYKASLTLTDVCLELVKPGD